MGHPPALPLVSAEVLGRRNPEAEAVSLDSCSLALSSGFLPLPPVSQETAAESRPKPHSCSCGNNKHLSGHEAASSPTGKCLVNDLGS